jgi:hypothetical protein
MNIQAFWEKYEDIDSVPESDIESFVQDWLHDHWETHGEDASFEKTCDETEAHQDIVRKVYDRWINEYIIEGPNEKAS